MKFIKKRGEFLSSGLFALAIIFFILGCKNETMQRIRDEGLNRSHVQQYIWNISDRFGPRLPASSNIRKAQQWILDVVENIGLENARFEGIGRKYAGWNLQKVSVHMVSPDYQMCIAYPLANTPGTDGVLIGDAMIVSILKPSDLDRYRGRLSNKIVLIDPERKVDHIDMLDVVRHDERSLKGLEEGRDLNMIERSKSNAFYGKSPESQGISLEEIEVFLKKEKVAAVFQAGQGRDGSVRVGRRQTRKDDRSIAGIEKGLPILTVAAEHYNRIYRLLSNNIEVQMEIDVNVDIPENEMEGRNVIAELPGSDLKDEIVMIGAHLDSWHAGTGATDNGCGVAVVLEAMRILKALNLQPRRTIRMGFWTDEETGRYGSKAYVIKTFGTACNPKSAHEKFSIYFNTDSGSGRFRGVHVIKNKAAAKIFKRWMKPFHDLGVQTISNFQLTGSDHSPFNAAGLPGVHFVQDRLDYRNRTWHYNMDTYDHVILDDLKINAIILASFAWQAAMMDDLFPRVKCSMEKDK